MNLSTGALNWSDRHLSCYSFSQSTGSSRGSGSNSRYGISGNIMVVVVVVPEVVEVRVSKLRPCTKRQWKTHFLKEQVRRFSPQRCNKIGAIFSVKPPCT